MCCNEEFLSQKSFKDECIFQLKRHLENGMRFSKVMLQDFKEYLLISHEKVSATNEKKCMSLKYLMSILCQTVVHWHCWHGAGMEPHLQMPPVI